MNKKILLFILVLLSFVTLSGCKGDTYAKEKENLSRNIQLNEERTLPSDYVVTIRDMASFLETKEEHYPLSDEFTERYQQTGDGYITNAKKAGIVVDKTLHSPNQKWHFFESWLYPSIEDGSLTWDESAKRRTYTYLYCPELLLWIYEASGVEVSKIVDAKIVAEAGKVAGKAANSIAADMRKIVAWEDIEKNVIAFLNNDTRKYSTVINEDGRFTVSKLQTQYHEGDNVTFTISVNDKTKEIDKVTVDGEELTPSSGTTYKFVMPANDVVIMVTLKEKEQTTTPPVEGVVNTYYKVIYDLQTAKQAKKLESVSEVMAALECSGEGTGILNEISSIELVYGGGNGGSGDSKWIAPKVLKIGTTSVNGSITFDLAVEVIGIKITGYIHKSSCKIQAGDSNSADWDGGSDGKTTIMSNTGMTVISKDVLENGEPSTITIHFESTKSLKLAVINTTPLYITGIEFITDESN